MTKFITPSIAGIGTIITNFVGDWESSLLLLLIVVIIIDYISGLIAAGIKGELSSSFGLKGIGKKVLIFSIVTVAHLLDSILGNQHYIRDATILFYLVNEILSIIENAGRAGVPVPTVLINAVKALKERRNKK